MTSKPIAKALAKYLTAVRVLGESTGATGHDAMREGSRLLHGYKPPRHPPPDLVDCAGNQVWPPANLKGRTIECICGGEILPRQLLQYSVTAMACCSARCAMKLRGMRCECGEPVTRIDVVIDGRCRRCRHGLA